MKLKDKALLVIEAISASDKKLTLKQTGAIHRFAHIGADRCGNKHPDWVEDLEKTYEEFKKHKII
jgi:hypothetical protein